MKFAITESVEQEILKIVGETGGRICAVKKMNERTGKGGDEMFFQIQYVWKDG